MNVSFYSIYCYTNKVNQKQYIGQTKDLQKRCRPSNYKGCQKFYHAIQKYGWNNFERTILQSNLSLEEANVLEEYYIKLYDTINTGYNLKSGGLNNVYSDESKQKMSNSNHAKRKIICLETGVVYDSAKEIERQHGFANTNIIACCLGKLLTAYDFHWEYYENRNNPKQTQDKRKRAVYCISNNTTYDSAAAASRALNVQRPNITKCCQKLLFSAGGYYWCYADEKEIINET